MTNILLLFFVICLVISTICVINMSRLIVKLMKENTALRESISSLFIEAVWPPHEQG